MNSSQRSSQSDKGGKKQQTISSFFTKEKTSRKSSLTTHGLKSGENEATVDDELIRQFSHRADSPKPPKRSPALKETELPERKRLRRSDSSATDTPVVGSKIGHESTLHAIHPNITKTAKTDDRTAKYLYSVLRIEGRQGEHENDDNEEETRRKARLHEKFMKKLGNPDRLAEAKKLNGFAGDNPENDEPEIDGSSEEDTATARSTVKGAKTKKTAAKQTPMEKQVIDIKMKHPDTLLVVEVGYKFRFFGDDARIAAKELSIVCIPGKLRFDNHPSEAHLERFASASIPIHRLHVHVKRLVTAGHKVGIVRQLETAALKAAGDNRNAPFVRELTNLYTKGTYVDDIGGLDEASEKSLSSNSSTAYVLCLTETKDKGWGTDEKVHVGIVAVQPTTGDVIYDDFQDGFMRTEIETRLLHISPCELLIVGELSKSTRKLVQHLSESKMNIFGDKVRVEEVRKPKTMVAQAYNHISNFYASKIKDSAFLKDTKAASVLDKVLKLPEQVAICLSAMISHLSEYGLEHVFDLMKYFQPFSARSYMLLNGTTLTSLEIYQNQTDYSPKGSLFWALDRTQTRFGRRLLRKWVGRPLLDMCKLQERIFAIEELRDESNTNFANKLKDILSRIKNDLEKSLIKIYYGKCSRSELLNVLQTLQSLATSFAGVNSSADTGPRSVLINDAVTILPTILDVVVGYLDKINAQAAHADDKYSFFREDEETETILEHKLSIAGLEHELDEHRAVAAEMLKKQKVEYTTVAGIEYLIEVENSQLKRIPASWAKISGTKKVSRFHTPEVIRLVKAKDQHRESLAAACDAAFKDLLNDISSRYSSFRDCVQSLATLDCLLSLATIAAQPGYVKPEYVEGSCIAVKKGRHPMVEQLLLDAYVPNDTDLSGDGTRALLVTGPNMGGKSSYVRQIALIAIMGQIGSYVPAEAARLGMLDAVFTRMGAFDNMMAGESTFMVELSETSDILKQASPRSLIILDELGRGTSTHDGVAIAQAVLQHIVRESRSLALFITHYQNLSRLANAFDHDELKNVHVKFTEGGDGKNDITFLYEVGEGVAHRSYGLNVARLANVPRNVLEVAAIKSRELEDLVKRKQVAQLSKALAGLSEGGRTGAIDEIITGIEEL